MAFNYWFIVAGLVLLLMALTGSLLKRLPFPPTFFFLGVGFLLGPHALGALVVDPIEEVELLERLTEIAVILSLFAAGLKMRTPLSDWRWRLPIRLAFISMTATVALIAATAHVGLGLSLGAAVLLGAVLAPTDPVLASEVQIDEPNDRDRLRFSLTGEAGLNDGTAFPFVMLGLGLVGAHELGAYGWRWLAVDVVYAVTGGLAIGALFGAATGRLVVYLRQTYREAIGLDDFLALGLVSFSYGVAIVVGTYAFLAAFAAGLALRAVERRFTEAIEAEPPEEVEAAAEVGEEEEVATNPAQAPAQMASAVLGFAEQFERMALVTLMILTGALLPYAEWSWTTLGFVLVLFFVLRPVAVLLGLGRERVRPVQRALICWFGIRGIGSLYYLTYAIRHGLPEGVGLRLLGIVLTVIAVSVVAHGLSVAPFMSWYRQRVEARMAGP